MNTTQKAKLVRFAGHDCVVQAERYASTGHTALSLYDAKSGEPVATATINLPDIPLSPNQVFIKDYSENEGMLAALEKAGIIEVQGCYVPTGIGSLPVCELLIPPPEQEKCRREPSRLERTGFADSHGDFAKELLADMEQKRKTTLAEMREQAAKQTKPRRKARDIEMDR